MDKYLSYDDGTTATTLSSNLNKQKLVLQDEEEDELGDIGELENLSFQNGDGSTTYATSENSVLNSEDFDTTNSKNNNSKTVLLYHQSFHNDAASATTTATTNNEKLEVDNFSNNITNLETKLNYSPFIRKNNSILNNNATTNNNNLSVPVNPLQQSSNEDIVQWKQKKRIQDLEERCKILENQLEANKRECENTRHQYLNETEYNSQIRELLKGSQQENAELRTKLNEMIDKENQIMPQLRNAEKHINEMNTIYLERSRRITELERELKKSNQQALELSELQQKYQNLLEEKTKSENNLVNHVKTLQQRSVEIDKLKAQLSSANEKLVKYELKNEKKLKKESEGFQTKLEGLQEQSEFLKSKILELQEYSETLQLQNSEFQEKLKQKTVNENKLLDDLKRAQQRISELTDLPSGQRKHNEKILELEERIKNQEKLLRDKEFVAEELIQEKMKSINLTKENGVMKADLEVLKQKLEEQNQEYNTFYEEFHQIKSKYRAFLTKHEKLLNAHEELKKLLRQKEERIIQLSNKVISLKEQNKFVNGTIVEKQQESIHRDARVHNYPVTAEEQVILNYETGQITPVTKSMEESNKNNTLHESIYYKKKADSLKKELDKKEVEIEGLTEMIMRNKMKSKAKAIAKASAKSKAKSLLKQ